MLLKQSTRRQTVTLDRNNKEADTRLILHACEAVSEGNDRLIVICSDTDIPLLLLHFMPSKAAAVRMTARIAKTGNAIHCTLYTGKCYNKLRITCSIFTL